MLKVDMANHDNSNYKYAHSQYDNTMDISLAALQSFHVHPKYDVPTLKKLQKK